ncbi:hypothetical protein ACP70R_009096 [Stipagrostis hirtigluma subsp. patula]
MVYISLAIDRRSNNACGMGALTPPRRRIRWRTKHYLSVAMVGVLVATALVAGISIGLAPAHLTFSITEANIAIYGPSSDHIDNTHLNFTLLVNNSSPRTAVRYGPMTGEIWYGPAATVWVRYAIRGSDQHAWQKPLSNVSFYFSADYGYNQLTEHAVESCRIQMVSKVWFAWRGLRTLPYTISLSCEPVDFVYNRGFPVRCA